MKSLYYTKHEIDDADVQSVVDTLRSDWLTQGPVLAKFEDSFAEIMHAPYAVAVNNGTSALHLAVMGLGLSAGQRVLVTPLTFVASANCALYQGANVEFVDIDPNTLNIDINLLKQKISSKPKGYYAGVIVVDFAGNPVNTAELYGLIKQHGMWLLEDASHAPGANYLDAEGNRAFVGDCRYADATTFSFHPAKHIACGEGGMITTKSEELFKKICLYRTHGIVKNLNDQHKPWMQDMQVLGYNFRLSDINAALGISQLKKLKLNIAARLEIAKKYNSAFEPLSEVETPKWELGTTTHALHLYILKAQKRDELYIYLREHNIICQVHYVPVYRMSHYKNLGFKAEDYPETEKYFESCISLPIYPGLTTKEQDYVIDCVYAFYNRNSKLKF